MTDRIDQIIEKLQQLKEIRQQLINKPMSPPGAWIHEYEVRKRYKKGGDVYSYWYAKWQANKPIFKRNPKPRLKGIVKRGKNPEFTCHQHIGRVDSSTGLGTEPEVEDAYQEWENRKRLDAIDKALKEIEAALIEFMPQENNKAYTIEAIPTADCDALYKTLLLACSPQEYEYLHSATLGDAQGTLSVSHR